MSDVAYPKSAHEMVSTLAELYRVQNNIDIAALLESTVPAIEYLHHDNYNGGMDYWSLRLEVPIKTFAQLESNLSGVEDEILKKVWLLERGMPHDCIKEISFIPISAASASLGKTVAPAESEVERLWGREVFKLFLSHKSEHKVQVAALSKSLTIYGISAFVAHEDISPSLEWQNEIETALRSMDALVAILTEGFHKSFWCDHEVGWAYGRGVLALPVILGEEPYGFLAKIQGIKGADLSRAVDLAGRLVSTLLANQQTSAAMRRALIGGFSRSISYDNAKSVGKRLFQLSDFTSDEKSIIWNAQRNNDQIRDAFGVPEMIRRAIGNEPEPKKASFPDEVPF
jgi:hypothetical protein